VAHANPSVLLHIQDIQVKKASNIQQSHPKNAMFDQDRIQKVS
jgi:hypothetical protein